MSVTYVCQVSLKLIKQDSSSNLPPRGKIFILTYLIKTTKEVTLFQQKKRIGEIVSHNDGVVVTHTHTNTVELKTYSFLTVGKKRSTLYKMLPFTKTTDDLDAYDFPQFPWNIVIRF